MAARPIYVEILIRAPLEELWTRTQQPDLHERWDLRFSRIEYLPRPDETAPQRFLYAPASVWAWKWTERERASAKRTQPTAPAPRP